MRKPAFGSKWLDYHYDYDDPPEQASGSADTELSELWELSRFYFGESAPAGFRIFEIKEHVSQAPERVRQKWKAAEEADRAIAAERAKGRLEICKFCREFFRTASEEVGVAVCPSCRNRPNTGLEPTTTAP